MQIPPPHPGEKLSGLQGGALPGLTLFTGPNGSGKTNLIEALSYASTGKSFRTGSDGEIIGLGEEEGTILVDFEAGKTVQTIKIKLTRSQGKKIFLNDTAIRKRNCWACSAPSSSPLMNCSSSKALPSCAAVSWTWKFPRYPQGTTKNFSAAPERCSSGTAH